MSSESGISDELLLRWARSLRQRRFYGKTVLSWEDGQIFQISEDRTLKKQSLEKEIMRELLKNS